MISILSKKGQRQIEMFEYLKMQTGSVSFKTLAEKFEISKRTVYDDVRQIQDTLPIGNLLLTKNQVTLLLDGDYPSIKFVQKTEDVDAILSMLLQILRHEDKSINQLAAELFMNKTTLYRMISQLNDTVLKSLGLKIISKPVRLEGNEEIIRIFLAQIIYELTERNVWPFNNRFNVEEYLESYTQQVVKQLSLPWRLDHSQMRFLKLLAYISIIRTFKGHLVALSQEKQQLIKSTLTEDFYRQIEADLNHLSKTYQFNQSVPVEDYINQMYYQYLQEHLYYTIDEFRQQTKESDFAKKSYDYLWHWVDQLIETYPYPIKNKEKLVLNIHNTLSLRYSFPNAISICVDRKGAFLHQIKESNEAFYQDVHQGLTDYCHTLFDQCHPLRVTNLMFMFFTSWEGLFSELINAKQRLKVYVANDLISEYSNEIIDILRHYFGTTCDFESTPINDQIKGKKFDLVISNYPMSPTVKTKVLQISDFPNKRDLVNIQRMILKLQRDNGHLN